MESAVTHLLDSFQLGELRLPNRVVMAPMSRVRATADGLATPSMATYYAQRATAGLIVTEGVQPSLIGQSNPGTPGLHTDEQVAAWRPVTAAVHTNGGRIFAQLMHGGRVSHPDTTGMRPVGPSAIPAVGDVFTPTGPKPAPTPRALDTAEVPEHALSYARAARRALDAGFDGVELHGAHGYLIDQFLWSGTNRRTDAYGGDPVARATFAAEVVAAVRAAVSPEFPVIFRYSQWKQDAYDARLAETPQELEAILAPLAAAGVDAFHASTRRYWLPEFEDSYLNLAGWTKKLTGRPAITVGSVGLNGEFLKAFQGEGAELGSLDDLLDRMERDEFDLVAVGRALLQDPNWAAKVLAGRFDELTPYEPASLQTLS